jgi:hypothetical protein
MEEQVHGLPSFDWRDLSAGLEELRLRMAEIKDERATEVVILSRLVMEICDTLINLRVLPIRDVPQLPKLAQEVLVPAGLILEHLREEHASNVSPWI